MLLGDSDSAGTFRQQLMAALADPEVVNLLHQYSDYDTIPDGLHHQLGLRHDQSSYGDHTHDGNNSSSLALPIRYAPILRNGGTSQADAGGSRGNYRVRDKWVTAQGVFVYGGGAAGGAWSMDLPLPTNDGTGLLVGTYWIQNLGSSGTNNRGILPLNGGAAGSVVANFWDGAGNGQLGGAFAATVLFWFNLSYWTV